MATAITDNPVVTYLQDPQSNCLAYRQGRWTVIPTSQAKAGFFEGLFSSSTTEVKTINSVQLRFEKDSIDKIDEAFTTTVSFATTQQSLDEDEGFDLIGSAVISDALVAVTSDPASMLESLNELKRLMSADDGIIPSPHIIADYESAISKLPPEDHTTFSCQFLLSIIKRMLDSRQTPPQASLAASAEPASATENPAARLARIKENQRASRAAIAQINEEIDQLAKQQRLEETLRTLRNAYNGLNQISSQFVSEVTIFTIHDKDLGAQAEIFNEEKDLTEYERALGAYTRKKEKLTKLRSSIEEALTKARDTLERVSQEQEFSGNDQVDLGLGRVRGMIESLQQNLMHLSRTYEPSIEESSAYTKIKERYHKRRVILQEATEAINAHPKKEILLSVENGSLKVEDRPLILFGKKIETITLQNGLKVTCKQDSREALEKLFALAMPTLTRPVTARYLADAREEFLSALASKSK